MDQLCYIHIVETTGRTYWQLTIDDTTYAL